jgi:DNA repair protein RecO
MAYAKYTTDAIVLKSFEQGEANKTIVLFTRDFGLIFAKCVGLRKNESKMRYALQDFSRASASLVRGKRGWRLAGATSICAARGASTKGLRSFSNISKLLGRLIQGEEENTYLFDAVREAHMFLLKGKEDLAGTVELLCVARILHALGYLSAEAAGEALFKESTYSESQIIEAERVQKMLLKSVNEAIAESQL